MNLSINSTLLKNFIKSFFKKGQHFTWSNYKRLTPALGR